jgi:hypothetical protein
MKNLSRVDLARGAYKAAVDAARAEPTPARWARLLRAGKNLRDAIEDAARDRSRLRWGYLSPSWSPG